MPLYDHFHGPIARRQWESFHSQWASCISADLNKRLPKRFISDFYWLKQFNSAGLAERNLSQPGAEDGDVETPLIICDRTSPIESIEKSTWKVPAPDLSIPTSFPFECRVEVRDTMQASRILSVIEFVSPGNKDDNESRQIFAGKCLSYLAKGMGLVIIDIVTARLANLHNWMVKLAKRDDRFAMNGDPTIYTAAYRPVHRNKEDAIDFWTWKLEFGTLLPIVPLALKEFGTIPLDLETTYREACERSRIPE